MSPEEVKTLRILRRHFTIAQWCNILNVSGKTISEAASRQSYRSVPPATPEDIQIAYKWLRTVKGLGEHPPRLVNLIRGVFRANMKIQLGIIAAGFDVPLEDVKGMLFKGEYDDVPYDNGAIYQELGAKVPVNAAEAAQEVVK